MLRRQDLKVGKAYFYIGGQREWIYLHKKSGTMKGIITWLNGNRDKPFYSTNIALSYNEHIMLREATAEEEQWLRECIKQDKYIPLENVIAGVDKLDIF